MKRVVQVEMDADVAGMIALLANVGQGQLMVEQPSRQDTAIITRALETTKMAAVFFAQDRDLRRRTCNVLELIASSTDDVMWQRFEA